MLAEPQGGIRERILQYGPQCSWEVGFRSQDARTRSTIRTRKREGRPVRTDRAPLFRVRFRTSLDLVEIDIGHSRGTKRAAKRSFHIVQRRVVEDTSNLFPLRPEECTAHRSREHSGGV